MDLKDIIIRTVTDGRGCMNRKNPDSQIELEKRLLSMNNRDLIKNYLTDLRETEKYTTPMSKVAKYYIKQDNYSFKGINKN